MQRALVLVAFPIASGGCLYSCGCPIEREFDAPYLPTYDDAGGLVLDAGFTDAGCEASCLQYRELSLTVKSCGRSDMGGVHCIASEQCVGGRRPQRWVRADARARDVVGAWLANAAQLEAASVPAFEILARELRAHAAPPSLISRALASADDERRHAAIMTRAARRLGATPGPVRVLHSPPRGLESIARENAVEGLVREAYGALVAIDPAIGADERRHAALAADVHAWIRPRLDLAARRRVDVARAQAHASLIAEVAVEPATALREVLGLPEATRAVELARGLA